MSTGKPEELVWTTRLPMFSNLFLIRDLVRVALLSALAPALLIAALALWETDYENLGMSLFVYGIGAGALLGLCFLAMLFMLGGATTEFAVTDRFAAYLSKSRRLKWTARLSVLAGAARGGAAGATAMGAGLISAGKASFAVKWKDLLFARCDDRRRLIHLHDDWHTVLRVWCTPENYDRARAIVTAHLPERRPADTPRPAAWGLLTLLAALLVSPLILAPELPLDIPVPFDVVVVLLAIVAGFAVRKGVIWGALTLAALAASAAITWAETGGLSTWERHWQWALGVEFAAYGLLAFFALMAIRRGLTASR